MREITLYDNQISILFYRIIRTLMSISLTLLNNKRKINTFCITIF